jgi:hypothetical protein
MILLDLQILSQNQSQVAVRLAVYSQSVHLGAKPLEDHDQRFFLANEPLRSYFLCNILSDERMSLSFMNMLGFRQVYVSHL